MRQRLKPTSRPPVTICDGHGERHEPLEENVENNERLASQDTIYGLAQGPELTIHWLGKLTIRSLVKQNREKISHQ